MKTNHEIITHCLIQSKRLSIAVQYLLTQEEFFDSDATSDFRESVAVVSAAALIESIGFQQTVQKILQDMQKNGTEQ